MYNLEQILEMWKTDGVIDKHDLSEESIKTPKLHAKYLELLSIYKLQLKKTEGEEYVLLKDKFLYYNGKMTQEEIEDRGWEYDPFHGMKILKGDMEQFYRSDKEIQAFQQKIEYYKTIISTLEEIIGNIKWRSNTIKNIIEWKKFEAGG